MPTINEYSTLSEIFAAVRHDGRVLIGVSDELKDNKDFMLAVVKLDRYALHYASKRLQGDEDVVRAAVAREGHALIDASDELKNNKTFIISIAKEYKHILMNVSRKLQDDEDVVRAAILLDGQAIIYAGPKCRKIIELINLARKSYNAAGFYFCPAKTPSHTNPEVTILIP